MPAPLPIVRLAAHSKRSDQSAEAPRIATPLWVDALMLGLLVAVGFGVMRAALEWRSPLVQGARIDLSPWRLPYYAGLSTLRMTVAYLISLVFSLVYARIAAGSRAAERVMLPVLDILQSVPILSFMPGVVLGLTALFPGRTIGLELAAVILIFTSQAWNLAFSFHQSLMTIPRELSEAASVYRLGLWRRFTRLELPSGVIALLQNSMMSWAGGWFFLMASEQFTLGDKNLRLPGLGSFLAAAAERGDFSALALGLAALIIVIVLLDQLVWRPLVTWSDRFKFEQSGGEVPRSIVYDAVRGSTLIEFCSSRIVLPLGRGVETAFSSTPAALGVLMPAKPSDAVRRGAWSVVVVVAALTISLLTIWGTAAAFRVVIQLSAGNWRLVGVSAGATLLRTTIALVLAAAWTIPVGVAIGLSTRWSQRLQPIVQIAASIPATAVFPVLLLALLTVPGGLNIAAVGLMLLGTQWYILFNVIAGAMAIPSDLKEAAEVYRIAGWQRWKTLILPAIFPYLVTGMITATGGAWNASIVSEYVTFAGKKESTTGLGALIAQAADKGNFPLLLAGTLTMAAIVIAANRLVWRRLYGLAESRYRLD
jgi:NitT/TauT family transport system permease protein